MTTTILTGSVLATFACVSVLIANMGGGMRIKNKFVETIAQGLLLIIGTFANGLTATVLMGAGVGVETIVALDVALLALAVAVGAILAVATRQTP